MSGRMTAISVLGLSQTNMVTQQDNSVSSSQSSAQLLASGARPNPRRAVSPEEHKGTQPSVLLTAVSGHPFLAATDWGYALDVSGGLRGSEWEMAPAPLDVRVSSHQVGRSC